MNKWTKFWICFPITSTPRIPVTKTYLKIEFSVKEGALRVTSTSRDIWIVHSFPPHDVFRCSFAWSLFNIDIAPFSDTHTMALGAFSTIVV